MKLVIRIICISIITVLSMVCLLGCGQSTDALDLIENSYPKDIFRIYDNSTVVSYDSYTEDDSKKFNVTAESNHKTEDIYTYYTTLLTNANNLTEHTVNNMYEITGDFYGYDFVISIYEENDNEGKTSYSIILSEMQQENEDQQEIKHQETLNEQVESNEENEFVIDESNSYLVEQISLIDEHNILLNGKPFYMNPEPIVKDEMIWMPAVELFDLMGIKYIIEGMRIEIKYEVANGYHVALYFWSGQDEIWYNDRFNDINYLVDSTPFMENGVLYLSEDILNHFFGNIIEYDVNSSFSNIKLSDNEIGNIQKVNQKPLQKLPLVSMEHVKNTGLSSMVSSCYNSPAEVWIEGIDSFQQDGFDELRISLNYIDAIDNTDEIYDYIPVETDFPDEYKSIFELAHEKNIRVRYILSFWDLKYRKNGGEAYYDRLSTEEELDRYVDYVKMTVTELKGIVDSYELWNEPIANYEGFQTIKAEDYIRMLETVIPEIREIDPNVEVVVLNNCGFEGVEQTKYNMQILSSDAISLADGISLHTVNQDAMPQFKADYYYNYEKMIQDIMDITRNNGFEGYIIADELNYRTHHHLEIMNMNAFGVYPTDPIVAAKNTSRMMVINRGIGVIVGTSGTNSSERPLEGKIIKDYNRMMFNLEPCDISIEIESSSDYIRYYSFIDEMGSKYVAIWNDIAAEEKYMSIDCDIKISGEAFENAVWQDPYYSITQNLNTVLSDGLVINDLLIPDYPVFIKLY